MLGGLATLQPHQGSTVVTHYNILPTIDVYATTQDRDLGAVAADVQKVIDANSTICRAAPPSPCAARS